MVANSTQAVPTLKKTDQLRLLWNGVNVFIQHMDGGLLALFHFVKVRMAVYPYAKLDEPLPQPVCLALGDGTGKGPSHPFGEGGIGGCIPQIGVLCQV